MSKEQPVKTLTAADGQGRVFIMYRADGLFRFVEEKLSSERGETFWEPRQWSGLYDTLEHAEEGAQSAIPWLKAEKPCARPNVRSHHQNSGGLKPGKKPVHNVSQ